ncbi:MAG: aminotransferase class I/II-fold pyridoxal phosphate-dependent enzyme [Ignavibacteriaceae bacterium]|nr:aminotransferase class I/II-fold pyridoxal phosphate-dependent enzyme [Ignavibacteriaceae bacterium]
MNMSDPLDYFKLKNVKAARVSEISEVTESSGIPPEDRVNFHIGNPIQDIELSSAYLRLALRVDIKKKELTENDIPALIEEAGWKQQDITKLEFLRSLIKISAPYMPRGGFNKKNPNFLINYFNDWLLKNQQEPLSYDLGETSGRREIILASGGIPETLRILFHSLSEYFVSLPAEILLYKFELPDHLKEFRDLQYDILPSGESELIEYLVKKSSLIHHQPLFLVLGSLLSEETRRSLRLLSLELPLFFIEVNDAPNNLSIAREAKMMNRVLRFLTPGIFSPSLKSMSTIFIAGNSNFIKIIETIQFQLKGTPSSSEVELLSFILKENLCRENDAVREITIKSAPEKNYPELPGLSSVQTYALKLEEKLDGMIERRSTKFNAILSNIYEHEKALSAGLDMLSNKYSYDPFYNISADILLDNFINNINNNDWIKRLSESFLYSFLNHHPEYKIKNCFLVSGSSRTGLGLLGFHCGIKEVIIPDLSWTYEHCFPKVSAIALTDDLEIDIEGIKNAVQERILNDSDWKNYGAVVLNNPHNATGREFNSNNLKSLIKWLLERNVIIVDDLSYQNVVPGESLKIIKTCRQLADELYSGGYLSREQSDCLITIHSLSKTDSFAGARLSVIDIRIEVILSRFKKINSTISHNVAAVFLAYLFYRNSNENVNAYWLLRNKIFAERMKSLEDAVNILPRQRNSFGIEIKSPSGSMYPRMVINNLPAGLSLDWLASGLALQGIGLVPLSTFARTEKGFDTARKTFRLTLGGTDNAPSLVMKTRRVLIDLNRLIAEEAANYNRKQFKVNSLSIKNLLYLQSFNEKWAFIEKTIISDCKSNGLNIPGIFSSRPLKKDYEQILFEEFVPVRLQSFKCRAQDNFSVTNDLIAFIAAGNENSLSDLIENEFRKDLLIRREKAFRSRLYDRTVHPTQMYSLKVELLFNDLFNYIIRNRDIPLPLLGKISDELIKEFLGLNVAIISSDEPSELLLDLNTLTTAETYTLIHSEFNSESLLSFWGDWDGSNRPSGQGHSLVASVLIENVDKMARLLRLLLESDRSISIDSGLLKEINELPLSRIKFTNLLNQITMLTHQLEKRYKGTLPFNIKPGTIRRLGMNLKIAQDPLTSLWHHNDRLERKMFELRAQRKIAIEYFFSLNKKLRKTLYSFLPYIQKNRNNKDLIIDACLYRDLLKRFIITPRIHQKMITAQDQFAIDTTVHNINEINEIAGKYGNPGMVLALQVSMFTKPEAIISLDRKMRISREEIIRNNSELEIPSVCLVPLLEDIDSVKNLTGYLNKIWEYSLQSRRLNQDTGNRFSEIICEVFIAGSDLSQQVGQAPGMNSFKNAKFNLAVWLSEKDLIGKVRMKMGSGEPMQRQGGYYSTVVGKPAFIRSPDTFKRFSAFLKESTKKSTEYAATPLLGIFAGGDLRTFQSSLSEKLRYLPVEELSQLLYHIRESQKFYENEIIRAGEPIVETRLQFKTRAVKELERLTIGRKDHLYNDFLELLTDNFRQILYGSDDDVVGIHLISYFIARTTPPLRDRPTIRPANNVSGNTGQRILGKIAETIPFSRYGSMLRAIAHNQAQTTVLGINQLTTGLFRAFDGFMQKRFAEGEALVLIEDRILPNLPVYEILHSLRMYHDVDLVYLNKLEKAFPAGNSAFVALREDIDSLNKYLILFQRELLRRHGVDVNDFFEAGRFIPNLLPAIRPDLAVMLQQDFFNTDHKKFFSSFSGNYSSDWAEKVKIILKQPETIEYWRSKIWDLLLDRVFSRVGSFVELAIALNSLSLNNNGREFSFSPRKFKIPNDLTKYFGMSDDDNMHQFLAAAFEYLSAASYGMVEVPTNIIRAINEVEKIIKIEEQALSTREQDLLRFYLLQIARLTGENG